MSKPWTPTKRRKKLRLDCERKTSFESLDEATSHMDEVIALGKGGDKISQAYQCQICGKYHWGHIGKYPIAQLDGENQ